MNKVEDFQHLKKICDGLENFSVDNFLYYIGITNVKEDISPSELDSLIEICNKFCGDYTNPIAASSSLAYEVFEKNSITLVELKRLSIDEFYEWYDNGRSWGQSLKASNEPYKVQIGFGYSEFKRDGNIIIGEGLVYYYDTEEEYNSCDVSNKIDFKFKYNINSEKVFDVECEDEDAKCRVENDCDGFIDNIKFNLLPRMQNEDIEMERE